MRAIAAMSRNRVIGKDGAMPWRIRDEFRWFRQQTFGHVIIMGRRTFESLPKALDGRINIVLTRDPKRVLESEGFRQRFPGAVVGSAAHRECDTQLTLLKPPEVRLVRSMDTLERAGITKEAWLCGGAWIYQQFLPQCSELLLSVIQRDVEGDTFFPPFEHLFDLAGVVATFPEFEVRRYVRNDRAPT